jgi:pilus assembly protein CpaE
MSSQGAVNILLVDDNEKARANLIDLLRYPDLRIVGESSFGASAASWASQLHVDVVIVAIEEPVARALRTVELLTTGSQSWPVVAVSASNDRDMIRNAMLAGARDYVVLPAANDELRKSVLRVYQHEHERRSVPGDRGYNAYGTVITVFGVKGGIGKTATAVNLAAAITSGSKHHVALVDADLQFGDCAVMLDLVPERTICDAVSEIDPAKPHLIDPYLTEHSSRLSLLAAPTDPRDANEVTAEDVGNVLKSLAATRDFVVVDTSPQIDTVTALAIDLSAIVLLLVVPEVPSIRRTKAALTLLEEAGYTRDKLKLVVNRASRRSEVANADLEAALGYPIYMEVPDDRAIAQSITTGVPLVIANPKSDAGRAYLELGLKLSGASDGQRRRGLFGLFGRGGPELETTVAPPPNPIATDDALLGAWAPVLGGGATVERWAADAEEAPDVAEETPERRNIFLLPASEAPPPAASPGGLERELEAMRAAFSANGAADDQPATPASETRHG